MHRSIVRYMCLVVLALAVASAACASTGEAGDGWVTEIPFKWDEEYASPGTSLELLEKSRELFEGQTLIQYEPRASGFAPDAEAVLWMKQGVACKAMPASIDSAGMVHVLGADVLMIAGYVPGQALDVALESGGKRAQAKATPFPIEVHEGECWATVEILSNSGFVFLLTFGGFEPGEQLRVESMYKDEHVDQVKSANAAGGLSLTMLYGPGDRGSSTAKVTGEECGVSITYNVGDDALEVQ